MMSLYKIFVLLSVIACTFCESSEENGISAVKGKILSNIEVKLIREYVEQSGIIESVSEKLEGFCPISEEKLSNTFDSILECFNEIDNKLSVCSAMKNHFLNCTSPFIKIMDECMPEKSKGYPNLLANIVLSTGEYMCGLNGEHLIELSNTCIMKDGDSDEHKLQCEDKMKEKVTAIKKEIPSVSELCSLFDFMKPCWDFHVQDNCGSEVAKEAWIGFFQAISTPCSSGAGKGLTKN